MKERDIVRDGGPFNLQETLRALEYQAAKAQHRGDYGAHADLTKIHEFVETQAGDLATATSALMRIDIGLEEAERNCQAILAKSAKLQ